mgnify:CR=1 FL=1
MWFLLILTIGCEYGFKVMDDTTWAIYQNLCLIYNGRTINKTLVGHRLTGELGPFYVHRIRDSILPEYALFT